MQTQETSSLRVLLVEMVGGAASGAVVRAGLRADGPALPSPGFSDFAAHRDGSQGRRRMRPSSICAAMP